MDAMFNKLVMERLRRRNDVIERACEIAVQYGKHGVIVIDKDTSTLAYPSILVPYGELYQFPSDDAFDRWVENGCPK